MDTRQSSIRLAIAAAMMFCATAMLSVFYGMAENAVVYAASVFTVLAALSLLGPRRVAISFSRYPLGSLVAVAAIMLLSLNYQWSLSKDSSFAATWSLALIPLTFLIARELDVWRWRLHGAVSALVLIFACLSLWRFLAQGERPVLPLTDPNNYCSLLYMAMIPWAYRYMSRCWCTPAVRLPEHLAMQGAVAVITATIFVTQSRTGAAIIIAALAIFALIGISRRKTVWPVLVMIGVTVCVYLGLLSLDSGGLSRFDSQQLSQGIDVRELLNSAAVNIYLQHPLTGVGVNVFPLLYRMQRNPLDQETAGAFVHNDYLQLLAEGGPLLAALLVTFAAITAWRFLRLLMARDLGVPDPSFGVLMALGAVLAHAVVNFVLLTPILACCIGLSAALVPWQKPANRFSASLALLRLCAVGLLVWGWLCFAYLALDTFSVGVYQRQGGIPFAGRFNSTPDKLLAYSRFVQSVNGNRGVPVLAEASLYRARLATSPDSEYLQDLTLHTYRRAVHTDPWNPAAWLQMYDCIAAYPAMQSKLTDDEQPMGLLLRAVTLDPIYVPAYERLIAYFESRDQPEVGYSLVRDRLAPWLVWLARQNPPAAVKVLDYLRDGAAREQDADFQKSLEAQALEMARLAPDNRRMWFR